MSVFDHTAGRLSALDADVVRLVPPGGNWRDLPADFASRRVDQIRRTAAAGDGSRSTYYGKLAFERPSYTISTYFNRPGNGCYIHPAAERLITIREAARLQGFADSFRFKGRGRARYLQVGNAVPPLLAYQVARAFPTGSVIDLFAGAGGLSQGFAWAGNNVVLSVDNDRMCIDAVRGCGHATAVELIDLGDASATGALVQAGLDALGGRRLDTLIGGPPCQGFSTAGKNLASDSRNRLVFAFLDAVEAFEPDSVLMENVPALMWKGRRAVLAELTKRLRALGYDVEVAILHAEGYGLPQLRRRLFIQGRRDGEPVWPLPHRRIVGPAQPGLQPGWEGNDARPLPVSVADAISDLPAVAALDPDEPVEYDCAPTSDYQRWVRGTLAPDALIPKPMFGARAAQLKLEAVA